MICRSRTDVARERSLEAPAPAISISIVSHGHWDLVKLLLADLENVRAWSFEVLLTFNVPEQVRDDLRYSFPLRVIHNESPKGFGANHNAAFGQSRGDFFLIVNPDIRLPGLNITALTTILQSGPVAAAAPLVVAADGAMQDSARRFPTLFRLAWRVVTGDHRPDYRAEQEPIDVDWLAGMFVMFRREAFLSIGGFDERYFMYFEDVDICRRLRKAGWNVVLHPATRVVHDARRASHTDIRHLRWHLSSAAKYFIGGMFRK